MAAKTLFDKMHRTIATPQQLETMDRDLNFFPASPQAAATQASVQASLSSSLPSSQVSTPA